MNDGVMVAFGVLCAAIGVGVQASRNQLPLTLRHTSGGYAQASAYSHHSTGSTRQGCAGAPPLTDGALSVATFLVGCGHRIRVCYGRRCVVAVRWDSGPYVGGRQLDLNVGVVRALGFSSEYAWGVRTVRWAAA